MQRPFKHFFDRRLHSFLLPLDTPHKYKFYEQDNISVEIFKFLRKFMAVFVGYFHEHYHNAFVLSMISATIASNRGDFVNMHG